NTLHATHVLQVALHRDGNNLEVKASVIEVATQTHVREFSGSYSPDIAEDAPKALAGVVSAALHLHRDIAADAISPAAKTSCERGLYLLRRDKYSYEQALSLFKEAALSD